MKGLKSWSHCSINFPQVRSYAYDNALDKYLFVEVDDLIWQISILS